MNGQLLISDGASTGGDWADLQVWLVSRKAGQRAEQYPQAYVFYGTVPGFPEVRLTKNSNVTAVRECRVNIASAQPANIIRASVVEPGRGSLTYVLGYAKVGNGLWISFYGSSANPSDEAALTDIFKSLSIAQ
jgi:hypothetical protein